MFGEKFEYKGPPFIRFSTFVFFVAVLPIVSAVYGLTVLSIVSADLWTDLKTALPKNVTEFLGWDGDYISKNIWKVTLNKVVVFKDQPGMLMFDLWNSENCVKLLFFNKYH